MKKSLQTHHRPIIWIGSCFILGIIGGSIRDKVSYTTLFICLVSIILGVVYLTRYLKCKKYFILLIAFGLGVLRIVYDPLEWESSRHEGSLWQIGTVIEAEETKYGSTLLLDKVRSSYEGNVRKEWRRIKIDQGKDQVIPPVGSVVKVYGKTKALPKQMNPSDMDYAMYLKGKGVSREVQSERLTILYTKQNFFNRCREKLLNQIDTIFRGKDQGIVSCLLIGEDGFMNQETEDLYNTLGIGHVLVISGMHIGVLFGLAWWVLGKLGVGYKKRILSSLVGIWLYAALVGFSVSVVRACVLLTFIYIGRMLWEEEDLWISLMLAACIILIVNPYQLFQVGFQLSFSAYIGVILSGTLIRYCKVHYQLSRRKHPLGVACITQLVVTLCITPVLSWHFFEVPFLATCLNLMIIPLFGFLLPICLGIVIVSGVSLGIAQYLASGVSFILRMITLVGEWVVKLPYATYITGRPSGIILLLFYSLLIVILLYVYQKRYRQVLKYMGIGIGVAIITQNILQKPLLDITHLYVGQGDCSVVQTPNGKVILIDGGSEGKEKIITSYLKYRGIKKIDYMVVSHAHEDHIGGIIGLIEKGTQIGMVMMPQMLEGDEWEQRLKALCYNNDIPYHTIQGNEKLFLGEVALKYYLPQLVTEDTNEKSVVCLLTFKDYKQLFTGDMTTYSESRLNDLGEVTVLKVAHHGSNTSSSDKFLQQIQPRYGMISCGIKNRYNHPHTSVVERLDTNGIQPLRTDRQGAISFRTDGIKLNVIAHIQEEK